MVKSISWPTALTTGIAEWKIARAKQAISWAEHNKATLGGLGSEAELDTTALDEMQTIEFHLGSFVPGTVLTARAMLEMAIDILAYHGIDPEHVFATGPVLDIVRNCLTAFETLDGLQTLTSTRAR